MILKRTLTRKSILGFGYSRDRDLSVQMLLDLGRKNLLISSYYGLDKIDFAPDILEELGITQNWIISKPGKDLEKREQFFKQRLTTMSDQERIEYYAVQNKQFKEKQKNEINRRKYSESKNYLRLKNHNK